METGVTATQRSFWTPTLHCDFPCWAALINISLVGTPVSYGEISFPISHDQRKSQLNCAIEIRGIENPGALASEGAQVPSERGG